MSHKWRIRIGNKVSKPMTSEEVNHHYKAGRIPAEALLSQDGNHWHTLAQLRAESEFHAASAHPNPTSSIAAEDQGTAQRRTSSAESNDESSPVVRKALDSDISKSQDIVLHCVCGKRLTAPAKALGKKAECPACHAVIRVEHKEGSNQRKPSTTSGAIEHNDDNSVQSEAQQSGSSGGQGPALPGTDVSSLGKANDANCPSHLNHILLILGLLLVVAAFMSAIPHFMEYHKITSDYKQSVRNIKQGMSQRSHDMGLIYQSMNWKAHKEQWEKKKQEGWERLLEQLRLVPLALLSMGIVLLFAAPISKSLGNTRQEKRPGGGELQ